MGYPIPTAPGVTARIGTTIIAMAANRVFTTVVFKKRRVTVAVLNRDIGRGFVTAGGQGCTRGTPGGDIPTDPMGFARAVA